MLLTEKISPAQYKLYHLAALLAKKQGDQPAKSVSSQPRTIRIAKGKFQFSIPVQNILFVKSEHVYCRIFFSNDQQILQRVSLERLSERLPADKFLRVHRSFLVNIDHITNFSTSKIVIRDCIIPIGRTWRGKVLPRLRKLNEEG